jgi:hypothetical protein
MRGAVLNCRVVKILTLLMVIIPTPARSHANFADVPSLAGTRIRDILDEPDPDDTGDCLPWANSTLCSVRETMIPPM